MIYINSLILLFTDHIESILSFLAIVISYILLKSTIKAINEQNRPFISFSIEPQKNSRSMNFVIRNTGNRTANNVEIETKPALSSVFAYKKNFALILSKDGKMKLSGITPNQEIKSFFDSTLWRYKENDEDTIDKVQVEIRYKYRAKEFTDSIVIDFSYLRNLGSTKTPEDIEDNIKKIADSIISIDNSLKNK